MTKRVWILGAGFSRSLGAPLLNDLLSFRLRSRLGLQGDLVDLVYALYHYGMDFPEGYTFAPGRDTPKGEKGCWRDAEDFLEFLDGCVVDGEAGDTRLETIRIRMAESCAYSPNVDPTMKSTSGTPIGRLLDGVDTYYSAQDLQTEAKRIIAAEVCEFLRQPSEERLTPYTKWLRQLGPDDTIITFNYDCLLERLVKEHNLLGHLKLHVGGAESASEPGSPLLLKLHGSVDWKRVAVGEVGPIPFERTDNFEYAIEHPEDAQLLTPGGSKMEASENELQPLWGTASERIREAQKVYFIGYRIPESDASAREMILNALPRFSLPLNMGGLPVPTPKVPVTMVLGAAPHHDRGRLKSLLTMVGADPTDTGLWAQDYLAAWDPKKH